MTKLSVLATILLLPLSASATEWHNYGARAMGMGGTGTALAQGPVGAYWNPGGLDQKENPWGVEVPIAGHAAITGEFIQGANDLNQINKDCQAGGAGNGTCSQGNINNALAKMNRADNGVRGDFGGGVAVKVGKLAVFVNELVFAGDKPLLDQTNTTPATIQNNQSKIIERGIVLTEIGVGYGHELPFLRGVSAGANVKGMIGKVGYQQVSVTTDKAGNFGSLGKFTQNSKTSFQPGLDLGLLWDLSRTWEAVPLRPRFGVVFRNVNDPKFSQPDAAKNNGEPSRFSLQGNSRAGFALSPLHFINLTADVDLTRNLTPVDGVASQMAGVGAEVNIFNSRGWINIPLRGGLSRNIAKSGSKTLISLGAGLHLFHVTLDLAVNWSPAKQTVQTQGSSKSVPAELGAAAQLGVLFGGKS